jgi:hypothetical protein
LRFRQGQEIASFKENFSLSNAARRRDQFKDGKRSYGFSAAGFANDAKHCPLLQGKTKIIDRYGQPIFSREDSLQSLDLKERVFYRCIVDVIHKRNLGNLNGVWRENAACRGLNASLAAMIAELNAPVKYPNKN